MIINQRPDPAGYITMIFGLINWHLLVDIATPINSEQWTQVTEYTIQQLIKPFSVWSSKESVHIQAQFGLQNMLIIKLVSALQSIVSLSIVTSFILALRWRYKRG